MRKTEYFKAHPGLDIPDDIEVKVAKLQHEIEACLVGHTMCESMTAIVEVMRQGLRLLKLDESAWPLNKMMMQQVLLRILEIDLKDDDGQHN